MLMPLSARGNNALLLVLRWDAHRNDVTNQALR
jgi:hypothetical protein